jgi:hypothetical protein
MSRISARVRDRFRLDGGQHRVRPARVGCGPPRRRPEPAPRWPTRGGPRCRAARGRAPAAPELRISRCRRCQISARERNTVARATKSISRRLPPMRSAEPAAAAYMPSATTADDTRQAHGDLSPRAPADQRIEQDQDGHHRGGAKVVGAGNQRDARQQPGDTEADQAGGQGVAPPPEQDRQHRHGEQDDVRAARPAAGRARPSTTVATSNPPTRSQSARRTGGGADGPRLAPDGAPERSLTPSG